MSTFARRDAAAVVALFVIACGGSSVSRPGPLAQHFDDVHIAAVPLAEKQAVIKAQNDYSLARMEKAKAEADLQEAETELLIALNEREQAILEEKSADSKKKAADRSNDLSRINTAAAAQRSANLARKASDEKIAYLKVWRSYLQKQLLYTEENVYAKEARYELAKARLAEKKQIKPKGFELPPFKKQQESRSRRAERAKAVAKKAQTKASQKKAKWTELKKAAAAARGTGSGSEGG